MSEVKLRILAPGSLESRHLDFMGGLGAYYGSQPKWSTDIVAAYGLNPSEFYEANIELSVGTYIAVCWTSEGDHQIFLADGGLVIKD